MHTTKGNYQSMREEIKNEEKNCKNNMKMSNKMTITYLSIITLKFQWTNNSNQPQGGWLVWEKKKKKQDSSIYCLQETHFRAKDTHRLKVKG